MMAPGHGEQLLRKIGDILLGAGEMPDDLKVSTLVPMYKGKESLIDQGKKVLERVFERRMMEFVDIDK